MLILNNELFDPNVKKDHKFYETAQKYKTEVEGLRKKHGNRIVFKRTREHPMTENGIRLPMPPMTLPLRGSRGGVSGEPENWMYSESIPNKKDGVYQLRKGSLMVTDELIVDMNKKPDLAWFIVYICPLYGKEIEIHDRKIIMREKAAERRRRVRLENALYGESPLSDSGILKSVAEAWGLNAFHKDANELRFELEALLKRRDEEKKKDPSVRGTDDFLKDIKNVGEKVFKKSFLQKGFNAGILKREKSGDIVMTGTEEKLFFVPPEKANDWFNYFAEKAIADETLWKRLVMSNINNGYIDDASSTEQLAWLFKFAGKKPEKKTLPAQKKELVGYLT